MIDEIVFIGHEKGGGRVRRDGSTLSLSSDRKMTKYDISLSLENP